MLPSFRLIVVAFVCGFVAVSVGLHMLGSGPMAHGTPPVKVASATPIKVSVPLQTEWRRNEVVPLTFEPRFATSTVMVATTPATLTLHALNRATRTQPEPTIAEPVPLASTEPTALRPANALAVAGSRELMAAAAYQTLDEKSATVTVPKPVAPELAAVIGPDSVSPTVAMLSLSRPVAPPSQPATAPEPISPVAAVVAAPKPFTYGTARPAPAPATQRAVTVAAPEITMTESDEEPPPFYVPPSAPDYLDDSPVEPAVRSTVQPASNDPPVRVALAAEPAPADVASPAPVAAPVSARVKLPRARPTIAARAPARTVRHAPATRPAPAVRKLAKAKQRPRVARRATGADPFGGDFSGSPNTFGTGPSTYNSSTGAFNNSPNWQQ